MLVALTIPLFLAVLAVAAVCGLRSRRIPNALTLPALILALVLRTALGGGAVVEGLPGAGLALLILLPLFALEGYHMAAG